MPEPLSPETVVYSFRAPGDPQVAPDGSRIAYTLGHTARATRRGGSQVWICDVDGGNARQLTFAGERNRGARWSPDGSCLAFVSDRGDEQGLYLLPMEGGEPRRLTTSPTAIGDLAWSPDGSRLAYTAPVDPANPDGDRRAKDDAPPVRVTSRIDYKQDNRGYLNDTRTQVFTIDIATGDRRQVTSEPRDHNFPQWSPDGRTLAAQVTNRNGMCSQLALIDAESGATTLHGPELGVVATWAWSPDGARIVFAGDTANTAQTDFFLLDVASGAITRATEDLECLPAAGFPTIEPPSYPVWLDERHVLFHAVRGGSGGLYVIDLESGGVEQIEGSASLRSGLSVDAAQRFFVQGIASLERPGEIHVFDRREGTSHIITDYGAEVLDRAPMAQWERFDVHRNGYTTEAWLLKPPGFDPARRYPLVLDVHGGPNGFYGYGFNAVQQVLATNGFIVVYSNPRGSGSYGREFAGQVFSDWGGEDYHDLMAVVDKACERPYVDADRVGIWGYSYGGYMTAWAISQSARFKAAVCGAPCFDLESMWGTSDIAHHFGAVQWGGPPHENREWYAAHSPSAFAHRTTTPTLIVHGEADDRCPIGQGEQMFVALKQAGCEVEFARYPGGSHLFLRNGPPEHRRDVLQRTLDWFRERLGEAQPG